MTALLSLPQLFIKLRFSAGNIYSKSVERAEKQLDNYIINYFITILYRGLVAIHNHGHPVFFQWAELQHGRY